MKQKKIADKITVGLWCPNCNRIEELEVEAYVNQAAFQNVKVRTWDCSYMYYCKACAKEDGFEYEMIATDIGITEIIAGLNRVGAKTEYSCHGHWHDTDYCVGYSSPYIQFKFDDVQLNKRLVKTLDILLAQDKYKGSQIVYDVEYHEVLDDHRYVTDANNPRAIITVTGCKDIEISDDDAMEQFVAHQMLFDDFMRDVIKLFETLTIDEKEEGYEYYEQSVCKGSRISTDWIQ